MEKTVYESNHCRAKQPRYGTTGFVLKAARRQCVAFHVIQKAGEGNAV